MTKAAVQGACAIALIACLHAVTVGAEALTWKDANKRSAELIRAGTFNDETLDTARQAFELYEQSPNYDAANHAQLLINYVELYAHYPAMKDPFAILDAAVPRIQAKAGEESAVLIRLWRAGVEWALALGMTDVASAYYERAIALATRLWSEADVRVIRLRLNRVIDIYRYRPERWARDEYEALRLLALKFGDSSFEMMVIDLVLAQLSLDKPALAAERLRSIIAWIEANPESFAATTVPARAYAALSFVCGKLRDKECAEQYMAKATQVPGQGDFVLIPTFREAPVYPRDALRRGIEGYVLMEVAIDETGAVSGLSVIDSFGGPSFESAAREAMRRWKFRPKVVDGKAVPTTARQPLSFVLGRKH